MQGTQIIGTGRYLPQRILTNNELCQTIDSSDQWIVERTGIKERRIASEQETTSYMGTKAAQRALDKAGVLSKDIDLVVLATATPDMVFPATAMAIQEELGITSGFAYDIHAVCSGFVYALATADAQIKSGLGKRALVIGSDKFSRLMDWSDRGTSILFGDGAGAVVLEGIEEQPCINNCEVSGLIASSLRGDGRHKNLLYAPGMATPDLQSYVIMEGRKVFKKAVVLITQLVEEMLNNIGISCSELDVIVPHQANLRIIEAVASKMGLSMDKFVVTLDKLGNTSAASIPISLDISNSESFLNKGDLVLIEAMGSGFTWGATLFRW